MRSLIWAAGLFDGEGSITLKHRSSPVRISLTMSHEETVRRYARIVGAVVYGPTAHGGHAPSWAAEASGLDACRILKMLIPHLFTKKERARIAVRVGRTINPQRVHLTEQQRTRRDELVAQFYGG